MKLLSSIALATGGGFVPSALAISQTFVDQYARHKNADKFVGNSMWLFGEDGVYAFSPDGSVERSHVMPDQLCEDKATYTGPSYRYCRFSDVVSDGKKYVWAGTYKAESPISVFDIDTGSFVGTFETCKGPNDLEYHPVRDEIWVRCSGIDVNATDPTHLDVLSASNPSTQIQTDILLKHRALEDGLSSRGYSVVHHTLGDVGYLTDDSNPHLFKIDLGSKEIMQTIELQSGVHGLYEQAYSPKNGHIFVRALMCCTCGTTGADVASCGRNDAPGIPVSPSTGQGAGQVNVMGLCGRSCSGKKGVDTVGVFEFDTRAGKVVATHLLVEGIGGDPYPSPDGDYIVLMGKNGGDTVRIIKAGIPGAPSTTLIDLELEFVREPRYDNLSTARDFAFVMSGDATYLVIPSGVSHKVAIVNFDKDFEIKHVTFSEKEFVNTAPHGRYRGVEWAVGTDYVWTNDSSEDEHYVIDVVNAKLVKTIEGIARSDLLSVQNWDLVRQREDMVAEVRAAQAVQVQAQDAEAEEAVDLGVVALIVGAAALFVGLANLHVVSNMKNAQGSAAGVPVPTAIIKDDTASVASSKIQSVA